MRSLVRCNAMQSVRVKKTFGKSTDGSLSRGIHIEEENPNSEQVYIVKINHCLP